MHSLEDMQIFISFSLLYKLTKFLAIWLINKKAVYKNGSLCPIVKTSAFWIREDM